jgi:hypothetical protein
MQDKLQINLFGSSYRGYRFPFTTKMMDELQNVTYKDRIKVCIHAEGDALAQWKHYFSTKPPQVETQFIQYPDSEYMTRVYHAQSTDCKYSCKLDDDVLVSRHVLDYILENLNSISHKHPIIAPILTNGMPSTELFIQDFLSQEDKKIAYDIFCNTPIESHFHLDYTSLDQKVRSMKEWNDREYWDYAAIADTKWDSKNLPWCYFIVRGMHPARLSYEYNRFIAERVFSNKDKFFGKNEYRFDTYITPYFTNNMFVSETEYWRLTTPIHGGGFDEGQLSVRMAMDNSSVLYIRNGFGIHMAYGMTHNASDLEKLYIENI